MSIPLMVLNQLHQEAIENKVPIINDQALQFIKEIIIKFKVKSILEIGTAIGYSALAWASCDPLIRIDTIERNPEMIEMAMANFLKYDGLNQITLHKGDALTIDVSLLSQSYDLIFIDAAKAQNINFFNRYAKYLNPDGIIITDNMDFHGLVGTNQVVSKNLRKMLNKIADYHQWLTSLADYQTEFKSIGDGLALSVRKGCRYEITD